MLSEYLSGNRPSETDPYYPLLVDDLLKGLNDWKNVQDIIRLTFKALSDVVRVQGDAIKDLEHGLQNKVNRSELTSALSLKMSTADVTRELNEMASALETKPSLEDIRVALEGKVNKTDLQYQLSSKVSVDEVKSLMDHKTNLKEFENEAEVTRYQLQQLSKELTAKIQTLPSQKDLQLLHKALEAKANSIEVVDALESKANKQAVANALQRKANKADVDSVLSRKPDVSDFQAVVSALESKADTTSLERLMQAIDSKVDRTELDSILSEENAQRPQHTELNSIATALVGLRKEVDQKLQDASHDTEYRLSETLDNVEQSIKALADHLEMKAEQRDFERLSQTVNRKAESEAISNMFSTLKKEQQLAISAVELDFQGELKRLDEAQAETASRLDVETHRLAYELEKITESLKGFEDSYRQELDESIKLMHSITTNAKSEFTEDVRTLKIHMDKSVTLMDELSKRKADRRDVSDLRAEVSKSLESKSAIADLQNGLSAIRKELGKSTADLMESVQAAQQRQERDLMTLIEKKPSLPEVQAMLNEKADNSTMSKALGSRVTVDQIQEFVAVTDQLSLDLRKKANLSDFESFGKYTRTTLEDLGKAILLKANMADMLNLLDQKAPADSTHRLLEQLLGEVDKKAPATETREFISDQKLINQSLCAENCVGRWIWKSGEVRSGYSVPWEVQTVNTFPDNFLWDLDKTSILCVAPGLYEVNFGFYSRRPPAVQLLVNGEPVLSCPKEQTGGKQILRHSAGNVAGLTATDFIALPARARVSLLFTGDSGAEGFLSLRKL